MDTEVLLRRLPSIQHAGVPRREDPESRPNDGYRLLETFRDSVGGMLLLTATPMQLHDFELYSMIELVEPGLFNGYGDFSSARDEIAAINRAVSALRSERPTDPALEEAVELLERFGAPELAAAVNGRSASRAAAAEWLSRCHRLSSALVRNRKAEVGGFTDRVAHRVDVVPGDPELRLQSDLIDYIQQRYSTTSPKKRTAVGLVLVAFQKMLCSSSQALAGSLETRAARLRGELEPDAVLGSDDPDLVEQERRLNSLEAEDIVAEVDTLTNLARRARKLEDAKLVALETLVDDILADDSEEKVLIFTQFHESIEMIRARLAVRHSVRVFHGHMSRDEKDAAHQAFHHGTQVLVSSEAGGEGRNFQFCHIVINYDLPWNPMKIEQRIGRIDRVGQKRDVEIYNFAVRGMLDERILDVLEHRIQIFIETVGALDPILESFEEEIGRIALGERGETGAAFAELDANLEEEIERAKQLEEARRDFVLDWRSLQREKASELLGRKPRATRADLESFCRAALGRFPVGSIEPDGEAVLVVDVPGKVREARKGVEEEYRGSFDVQTALADERLHFFAMGHPLVEAIVDNVGDPWWLPVTALESTDWASDEPALLVDYRLELHGLRDSGLLVSHLVTDEGVGPAVEVLRPEDPLLEVRLPQLPKERLARFVELSRDAARREALERFEEFRADHAGFLEHEVERIDRMFTSRRGFLHDRVARNRREVERLHRFGTESQKQIIPARQGQIAADEKRLAASDTEQRQRVHQLQEMLPSYYLRLLGVTLVVPVGALKEMAA